MRFKGDNNRFIMPDVIGDRTCFDLKMAVIDPIGRVKHPGDMLSVD